MVKQRQASGRPGSKMAFWMISVVHDNRLLRRMVNPVEILKDAGLKAGHQAFEVGCGPGFYTLAASDLVGSSGHVFAVDVNPWAIRRVAKQMKETGIRNVTLRCVNAADSGLPDQSIDSAFLFGLPRVTGGWENLIRELGRVVKQGGLATFRKSRRSEPALIKGMREAGFSFDGRKGRLLRFNRQ